MQLTDYSRLCIAAHGVLMDRDSTIIEGLAPLMTQLAAPPSRHEALAEYFRALHTLTDASMNTVSAHCVVYCALAEQWGLKTHWQDGIVFAATVDAGTLYEDAPGAIHYLRKFYRLTVVSSLDEREFAALDVRIGLEAHERLATGSFVAARAAIHDLACDPDMLLLSAGPTPASCRAGFCRIVRSTSNASAVAVHDGWHFTSLSDFIGAHQLALRREIL
ncbi:hypothetical protein GCM10010082_15360 [Kushneria pakistanensis]|uniref:Haloacid dehalogenase n=1 Tax=Kushneria pakistanensis TaxID=1508770 RepID=A0ABQ3FH33_9GAMM|nr:hypothetical protein [Kushneria pakistanensis]GHC23903.1 hypothetical protein GCM10010082_15360 [Kushneria pakistanensis]